MILFAAVTFAQAMQNLVDDRSHLLSVLAGDWEVVQEYVRRHVVRMAPSPVIFGRKI